MSKSIKDVFKELKAQHNMLKKMAQMPKQNYTGNDRVATEVQLVLSGIGARGISVSGASISPSGFLKVTLMSPTEVPNSRELHRELRKALSGKSIGGVKVTGISIIDAYGNL